MNPSLCLPNEKVYHAQNGIFNGFSLSELTVVAEKTNKAFDNSCSCSFCFYFDQFFYNIIQFVVFNGLHLVEYFANQFCFLG